MRIAEISLHSCPLRPPGSGDIGGMNLYIQSIANELNKLEVDVDIFARRHNPKEAEIIRLNKRTRLIHISAGEPRDIPKMEIYNCTGDFLSNIKAFMKIDGAKYDIIRSHYWTSALVAEQLKTYLKIPNVVTFHTLGEVKNKAMGAAEEPDLRIREEKNVVATADCIIAFTIEERDNLVKIYGGRPEKVRVIPGGVDLNLFHPMDKEKARRDLYLQEYDRVLLFVGRIQPIKGLDLLLHAMAQMPNGKSVKLLVAGGNSGEKNELQHLKSLASDLGIKSKVSFLGRVAHEKMPLLYDAADVCVMPSYHESFGMAAVESMATGTPVVASRVGGLATIIKDGETGFLVDEHSPEAFARHIYLLLNENGMRNTMAYAARASVMKFDWSLIASRIFEAYQEFVNGKINSNICTASG